MQGHAAFARAAFTDHSEFHVASAPPSPVRAGALISWLGSVLSLALLAGVGFWSWQLMVRDVSGVPVVQAFQGPARVQPEDPGGRQAPFMGLSVNEVPATGQAGALPGAIALAPAAVALADEDTPVARSQGTGPDAETGHESAEPMPAAPVSGVLQAALQVPAPEDGASAVPAGAVARAPSPDAPRPVIEVIPVSVPGPSASPRPPQRPGGSTSARGATLQTQSQTGDQDLAVELAAQVAARIGDQGRSVEVDPATLERGTRLVQLGVYDSRDAAVAAWDALARRVSPHMDQLGRVIEPAHSGGSVFYRLRAHGFDDDAVARRFCAVMVTHADCIPALVR